MDGTVLIADDDVNAQIIAETLLRLRGLQVRRAGDSTAACDVVAREPVGVLVLDLSLPGMDTFELLRRLRARSGAGGLGAPARILAVTDRQEPEVERFALRLGADAFLRKPLGMAQFIRTVERLARSAAPRAA